MLLPKRVKFRKQQRGTNRGIAVRGSSVAFGEFALKAVDRGMLTSRQIEAARKAIAHKTKRGGKLWIRIFPDKPVTKKGQEVPMGGGKGSVDHYVAVVKPGRILFEIDGTSEIVAREALRKAGTKLPLKVKIIARV